MRLPVGITILSLIFGWVSLTGCGRHQAEVAASREIHSAASAGNVEKVKALLKANPKLVFDTHSHNHATPLHFAASCNQKSIAELLLANNANVNAKELHGDTPLIWAAGHCHKEVVELLLAHQADVNASGFGKSALHWAAESGCKDVAELLLAHKAKVNAKDGSGWTPLHWAAMEGARDVAEVLLANSAEVNIRDRYGFTAWHYAVDRGHKDVAELLRQHGAWDTTTIHDAAKAGDLEKVKAFLSANPALVFSNYDELGDNPLSGGKPLHYAAEGGHKNVVELLLAKKADVNAKANSGYTPLELAAFGGHKDVAELLLANKADVNAGLQSPLLDAAARGHTDVVKLLLAHKADVNYRNEYGVTPLKAAMSWGNAESVALLRQHGGHE